SAAEIEGSAKTLIDSKNVPQAYSFYLAQPQFLKEHPQDAEKILAGLNKADEWINSHPDETAQILADSTGLDLNIAKRVLEKQPKPSPVNHVTADVVTAQQNIADFFAKEKLIPQAVKIQDAVWQEK
ncbi:MAG: hypothetical protein QM652_13685, partial [Legionella sp.]|uniref:hypothetical protein n=1 Tax=Legionella sp. TaxID=459 RepID=UPI0039E6C818